ncbi:MAG: class I SAM-dependent methyltransferase [Planctomycetota bacterium]
MAIRFWLTRPRMALARLRYWFWERNNPDKPWLCPGTVAFCETHLSTAMNAIEFGSGRSTEWFAKRVGHLTSVEHDFQWHQLVERKLADAKIANVTYRFVPLDHPEQAPEQAEYSPTPRYVKVADDMPDKSLTFAIVDGHYRTNCVRHLVPKIADGGYLLVDDINMWPSPESLPVPASWRVVDDSTNGVKRCIIWQADSRSDPSSRPSER